MRLSRVGALSRAPWGFADQAVSAATNVALTVVVARSSTTARFGEFSLAYVLFVLVTGMARTTGVGVLTIEYGDQPSRVAGAAASATGYAVGLGLLVGVPLVATGAVVGQLAGGALGDVLVLLGGALPALLLQDACRGLFFARNQPRRAFMNDLLWAVLETAALASVLAGAGSPGVVSLVLCWAVPGAVAAGVGCLQARVRPAVTPPWRWLARHRAVAMPLVASELLTQLPAHMTYLALPLVAGVRELGVVRAAYVFFGPLAVLNAGAALLSLPHAVQAVDRRAIARIGDRVSWGLAAVATGWAVLVVLVPARLGRAVVGVSFPATSHARLLLGVSLVAEAVLVGQCARLGALRRTAALARARGWGAPVTLVGGLLLAVRWGAAGVAAGFALGYWTAAIVAFAAAREAGAEPEGAPTLVLTGGTP